MSSFFGRIGSVPYLNAKPLIYGIEDHLRLEVPALLARDLREARLEAALIPIVEYLEHPHYQIVPGIAIASRGPVQSVYLAHWKPISQLQTVALDPTSKTSNLLLQIVLGSFYKCSPQYQYETRSHFKIWGDRPPSLPVGLETVSHKKLYDAFLLIGDSALLARDHFLQKGYHLLDLGQVWQEKIGLPFVFAVWAIREEIKSLLYLELFTRAKEKGLQNLEKILLSEKRIPKAMAREYLTRHIYYDLGSEEVKGILKFQRLCVRHGLIAKTNSISSVSPY